MAWDGIVVHHTAGADLVSMELPAIRRWHIDGNRWRDIGYHALVEKIGPDYVVLAGRPLNERGAHEKRANRTHLGLAFVGDFTKYEPSMAALQEGARWAAGMAHICGFGPAEVVPHNHFKVTACPGDLFPMNDFRALVALHLGQKAPQPKLGEQQHV